MSKNKTVKLTRREHPKRDTRIITIPQYMSEGAAGFDLASIEGITLNPGETRAINTGLIFDIPEGYELQIRPRSGLTLKTPLRVHLGTVDSDYEGEVRVICENVSRGAESVVIQPKMRIAQGVISKVEKVEFKFENPPEEIEEKEENNEKRGEKGFGSTGV